MKVRLVVLAVLLAATAVAGAKEAVSIRVSPAFSFAPANLVIRASVEPDAENRSMEVIADSAEFYRSSTITLEGDRAPKTTIVEFRTLPRASTKSRRVSSARMDTAAGLRRRTSTCSSRVLRDDQRA